MIVIFGSLDSSLEQAKLQGNFRAIAEDYKLFESFDNVVFITQDSKDFSDEFGGIKHVPCAHSRFKVTKILFSKVSFLRWMNFSLESFLWLLRNRREIRVVISENVDSPTPFIFSSLFKLPYYIRYNYDVATQVKSINKHFFEGVLLVFLEKLAFKRASSVWVMAPNLKEKAKIVGAKKIKLIPNWISLSEKPRNSSQTSDDHSARILFVGRLHPVKRPHLLVEAFSLLRKDYPQANLNIVGDGVERSRLERLVEKLGLSDSIKFLGFQSHENVLDIMRKSDLIVLPSVMEGNPRVLVEAMMIGLPVVATNVPGIKDMVQHARTGHLVEQATPKDLYTAISYVLSNKKYALEIAENARKFAIQEFSQEQVLNKIREDLLLTVPMYRKNNVSCD
jgi:glycosyltransferase involved in cell wall biosynthesis